MPSQTDLKFYSSLDATNQQRFLARLGYELTMMGRESYEVGTNGLTDPELLRRVNELVHRLLDHLSALLSNKVDRRDDATMVSILLEHNTEQMQTLASVAFSRSAERFKDPH